MSNEPMRDKNGNILTSSDRVSPFVQDEMYTYASNPMNRGGAVDSEFRFPAELIAFPPELVELPLEDLTEMIKARRYDARAPRLPEMAEKMMFVPFDQSKGLSVDSGTSLNFEVGERAIIIQLTEAEAVRLRAIGELLAIFDGDEVAQGLAGKIALVGNYLPNES